MVCDIRIAKRDIAGASGPVMRPLTRPARSASNRGNPTKTLEEMEQSQSTAATCRVRCTSQYPARSEPSSKPRMIASDFDRALSVANRRRPH